MSGKVWAALILAATLPQLALGAFDSNLPQFEGKVFGVRLLAYPGSSASGSRISLP